MVDANQIANTLAQSDVRVTGANDVTERDFREPANCVQKVVTDQLTVWKFASREEAIQFAEGLSNDHHVSDFVVLEFTPEALTETQKRLAAGIADATNTSD